MNTENTLEFFKKCEIKRVKNLEIKNEKDILNFFKKCELNDFEIKDHFNFKPIINEGLQKIKKNFD